MRREAPPSFLRLEEDSSEVRHRARFLHLCRPISGTDFFLSALDRGYVELFCDGISGSGRPEHGAGKCQSRLQLDRSRLWEQYLRSQWLFRVDEKPERLSVGHKNIRQQLYLRSIDGTRVERPDKL